MFNSSIERINASLPLVLIEAPGPRPSRKQIANHRVVDKINEAMENENALNNLAVNDRPFVLTIVLQNTTTGIQKELKNIIFPIRSIIESPPIYTIYQKVDKKIVDAIVRKIASDSFFFEMINTPKKITMGTTNTLK
jgi:hypothetical protein